MKTYSNKNALAYHVYNKHGDGEKKPCCELCHSEFTTDANLQRHTETAHQDPGQRSIFECDKCSVKFSRQDNLYNHLKEEHNVKNANLDYVEDFEGFLKNKCDQCDKYFKRKYQLQRHVNTALFTVIMNSKNNLNVTNVIANMEERTL